MLIATYTAPQLAMGPCITACPFAPMTLRLAPATVDRLAVARPVPWQALVTTHTLSASLLAPVARGSSSAKMLFFSLCPAFSMRAHVDGDDLVRREPGFRAH